MAASSLYGVSEETAVKRVYDHLLIRDRISAVLEAKQGLELFPESRALQVSYIRALCENGDETEAWEQWHSQKYLQEELEISENLLFQIKRLHARFLGFGTRTLS